MEAVNIVDEDFVRVCPWPGARILEFSVLVVDPLRKCRD